MFLTSLGWALHCRKIATDVANSADYRSRNRSGRTEVRPTNFLVCGPAPVAGSAHSSPVALLTPCRSTGPPLSGWVNLHLGGFDRVVDLFTRDELEVGGGRSGDVGDETACPACD